MFRKLTKTVTTVLTVAAVAAASPMLIGCGHKGESPDIAPHLIETPEASPERPIDGWESAELSELSSASLSGEQYRERVDELYTLVVDEHKKPIFAENDPVKSIYDAAVAVLDKYILNSWHDGSASGEYNIVHTVHDYIGAFVAYDFALYEDFVHGKDVSDSPAFDIDGVLLNGVGVCDGYSRAFNFLCAMENVDCVRVTGTYAGVPHAWNKVSVGGKLYNVDVTADQANYRIDDGDYNRQLSHGFFLLSDETFRTFNVRNAANEPPRRHVFDAIGSAAFEDYDYFAQKMFTVGDKQYPCTVKSVEQLNEIFTAVSKQKGAVGKLELKLDFPNKSNVNDADIYATEIADAYSLLKNPDFAVTATQRPYFQSPNGVYLFLLYR